MSELVNLKCVACRGTEALLTNEEIEALMTEVPEWSLEAEGAFNKLIRIFRFRNFREAIQFTSRIGEIAEEEGHHPLLQTEWGKVKVVWWTHKIHGLHKNDFIMAAKSDVIYERERSKLN